MSTTPANDFLLKNFTEALLIIAHAIYKEGIYTLNDYLTIRSWFSKKTFELARKLNCLNAVMEAKTIHYLVEEHNLTLPYKIPFARWLMILEHKILLDPLTRTTIVNLAKSITYHRFGNLVLSKLIRKTY